tara:strand:+ start:1597 stop:2136 length:540 start_codon:yes stop_codon:yes gene_type:complete
MSQEIISLTSEALERDYREQTPSQAGFTQDLMASNTIIPIIDLTDAALGTNVPAYQQQALAHGSQTAFDIRNTTTTIINTTGFWRITGNLFIMNISAAVTAYITATDGVTPKILFGFSNLAYLTGNEAYNMPFDFTFFADSGVSINISTNSTASFFIGSYRQTATFGGVEVLPSGFTPQ